MHCIFIKESASMLNHFITLMCLHNFFFFFKHKIKCLNFKIIVFYHHKSHPVALKPHTKTNKMHFNYPRKIRFKNPIPFSNISSYYDLFSRMNVRFLLETN